MKKMNKKGFTLIEMLVVIAIIAVLVSIIIPTVTSATDKAAAAANAANLRSIKAEVVTAMLTNDTTKYTFADDGSITGADASVFKSVDSVRDNNENFSKSASLVIERGSMTTAEGATAAAWTKSGTGTDVKLTFQGLTIAEWGALAGDVKAE